MFKVSDGQEETVALFFVAHLSPAFAGGSLDPTEQIHHATQYNLQHGTGRAHDFQPRKIATRKTYVRTRTRYTVNVAT